MTVELLEIYFLLITFKYCKISNIIVDSICKCFINPYVWTVNYITIILSIIHTTNDIDNTYMLMYIYYIRIFNRSISS